MSERGDRRWATLSAAIGVALVIVGIALLAFTRRGDVLQAVTSIVSIVAGAVSIVRAWDATARRDPRGSDGATSEPAAAAVPATVTTIKPLTRWPIAHATAIALGSAGIIVGATVTAAIGATPGGVLAMIAGGALFGWSYLRATPRTTRLSPVADRWDHAMVWFAEHGALAVLLVVTTITAVMYARIFGGETTGDDLSFHMAESRRIADCIAAGDWDFWNPSANAGYASGYYYQVIPQLASALPAALFDDHLFWFQVSLWLPQVAIPLAAYRGMRLIGASPWQALCAAFAVTFISGGSRWGSGADGTFWVGLYTQTWALAAFPLGLGHAVRYLTTGRGLAPAIGWGAFVFLCHPFASIALCAGLFFGVLAYYLQFRISGVLRWVLAAVLIAAIAWLTMRMISDPVAPAKPDEPIDWTPRVIYVAPLIGLVLLLARALTDKRALLLALVVAVALAFAANAIGFAIWEGVPKRPEGATEDLPAQWFFTAGASFYVGPGLLLAALGGRIGLGFAHPPSISKRPDRWPFARLWIIAGLLLVATAPGWLSLIVDLDGFGGFPHRVNDEVGPGYQELARWYTRGTLLDNGRLPVLTWALPVVILLARVRFARWLWAPTIAFAALLVVGPHAPKTADDLLPGVRFLGALQITLALAIGCGLYAIGEAIWRCAPGSPIHRVMRVWFRFDDHSLRWWLRTAVIAIAVVIAVIITFGGAVPAARVKPLPEYEYDHDLRQMNAAMTELPQGRKQVGPGAENHWWNLLSYVYTRRPSLLQMGGGGLQASPNYDYLWSVRDFPKLAWVYDTPLFVHSLDNAASAPAGTVLYTTDKYQLRRLAAPGIVSPIHVTGVLPAGKSTAGSAVRNAAIEWLRSPAPLANEHLAYDGYGPPGPPPNATVVRAFRVDPSPGDSADIYAEVDVVAPTTFVARESWHPRWHAYVDGEEVAVRRVTPEFPAIDVPPGHHVVAFRFERPWWAQAVWLLWPLAVIAGYLLGRLRPIGADTVDDVLEPRHRQRELEAA